MNILKASAVTASATAQKALLALIILSCGYHPLLSAEYETPRSSDPVKILGARAAGPDYRVEAPVHSDGLLRIYTLNTAYGKFYISGDTLLAIRLQELAAVRKLDKISQSKAFADGFKKAVGKPFKFVGSLLTRPGKTVAQTVSGVGQLFGRIGSGIAQPGSDPDGMIKSLTGASSNKREMAFKLGVDPYSDFPPLAERLDSISKGLALGGLTVAAATAFIGGAAGQVVSAVTTSSSVRALIRDKTPAQLRIINKRRLTSMGVTDATIERFFKNQFFTPTDQTELVAALERLRGVKGREIFVSRATQTSTRDVVFFHIRRAQLLADYHSRKGAIAGFVSAGGIPITSLRNGNILALFPIDELTWTEGVARTAEYVTRDLNQKRSGAGRELIITGQATPLSKKSFEKLGWRVTQNYR